MADRSHSRSGLGIGRATQGLQSAGDIGLNNRNQQSRAVSYTAGQESTAARPNSSFGLPRFSLEYLYSHSPTCIAGAICRLCLRNLLGVLQLAASGIKKPNFEGRAGLVHSRLVQFDLAVITASGCEGGRHVGCQSDAKHH
jgi:hypothetical protein